MLGRNIIIELFLVFTLHETKHSKRTITLEGRPMGPYRLGVFLVSPSSNCWQKHQLKSDESL